MDLSAFWIGIALIVFGGVMVGLPGKSIGHVRPLMAFLPVVLWGRFATNSTWSPPEVFWLLLLAGIGLLMFDICLTILSGKSRAVPIFPMKLIGAGLLVMSTYGIWTSVQTWPWTKPPPAKVFAQMTCPELFSVFAEARRLESSPSVSMFVRTQAINDVNELKSMFSDPEDENYRPECVADIPPPVAKFTAAPLPDGRSVRLDASASTGVDLTSSWTTGDPSSPATIVRDSVLWDGRIVVDPVRFLYTYAYVLPTKGEIELTVADRYGRESEATRDLASLAH